MESIPNILNQFIGKDSQDSVSPVMRWLNPIWVGASEKGLTFKHIVRKDMTNPYGTLHGGISALIIDDAIGATTMIFMPDYHCVTVNNSIDYKSSAVEGDTLIAETLLLENESKIIKLQCEIWNADRTRLIAIGISKMLKRVK